MNGTIYFRADHDLVGRVLAEKLRRRNDRTGMDDPIRVDEPEHTVVSMRGRKGRG